MMKMTAKENTAKENLKKASAVVMNLLTAPQMTAFVILTWFYTLGLDLLVAISNPSWWDAQVWITFGKSTIKDSIILFLAVLSKILKSAFKNENDEIRGELAAISKATLSLMNKAMLSTDIHVREYAIYISNALISQGVTLFDKVFFDVDKEKGNVLKVIEEIQTEARK